jgi:putative ABC transport system permease protein
LSSLRTASRRYLTRHPWQFGLSVLGIALGVAIVVSIDIANQSAARSFTLSMNAVAGKATHHVLGPAGGIPDTFYTRLRAGGGLRSLAPLVESPVAVQEPRAGVFTLLGVDVFAEREFRGYLARAYSSPDGVLRRLLTTPGAAVISAATGRELGRGEGDTVIVRIDGRAETLRIVGLVADDMENPSSLENLIITDIAAAQELTGRIGRIDRIDAIVRDPGEEERLRGLLPAGYELQTSGTRSRTAHQMVEAFTINLSALSMLALIVGVFLVYNTMTFSVVQRRQIIGTLRALGVTAKEVAWLVLFESLFVGLAGTVLGFGIAIALSGALLDAVSRAMNDLYYAVAVREVVVTPMIMAKGAILGLGGTLLSALKPASEAARIRPRLAISRSAEESSFRARIPLMSAAGAGLVVLGGLLLAIPTRSLAVSYAGILPVIAGFALLTPLMIVSIERLATPVFRRLFGTPGAIASRSITQNISRTHVAVAALALAVAATVGVGTMIATFRGTVVEWLEARLSADLFVSAPSVVSRRNDAVMPDSILSRVRAMNGVADVDFFRHTEVYQGEAVYHVIGSGMSDRGFAGFRFLSGRPARIREELERGDVIVSEPFAHRHDVDVGSALRLRTDRGFADFRIAGVYYDYASDQGLITIEYNRFREHWAAEGISGIAVTVDDPENMETVRKEIQALQADGQQLIVRSNRLLRESSIEIFDRTFAIARLLQVLSIAVAFIGILSALMALQLERTRELGIMRANGMLPRQVFALVNLQTLLMGATAGFLALPLGNVLAYILVHVINRRSFGWTMRFELLPSIMGEAMLLAVAAAIFAGIYPGTRMARSSPAAALRNE